MNYEAANDTTHGFCSSSFASIWITLHMITLDYPSSPTTQQRLEYTQWFELLGKVLPCSACRNHFPENLKKIHYDSKKDFLNRTTFARLGWRLHNLVNANLNKKLTVPWEDFLTFYEQLRAQDCSGDSCLRQSVGPQCMIQFVPEGSVPPKELLTYKK